MISLWPRFLFGLYECVCNNSLKPYHGEIIRPCYSDGHYRSTTCMASSLLIGQNGCWGAHQESCFVNSACALVHVCKLQPKSVFVFDLSHCMRVCLCSRSECVCACMWCLREHTHACRVTFSETWRREGKHLTHNWSAMKEIWSWICMKLTCSGSNRRAGARGGICSVSPLTTKPALKVDYNAQNDTPQKWQRKTRRIQGEQSWWQNR